MVVAIRRVRQKLRKRGWTQAEFSRRLGANPGDVSHWLSTAPGQWQCPKIPAAKKIEDLIGVRVVDWAAEDPDDSPLPEIPIRVRADSKMRRRRSVGNAA